jgi:hypothetical protein
MLRAVTLSLLLLGLLASCVVRTSAPDLPPGLHLAGDARALSAVLSRLERLTDTPVAAYARELRMRLAACEEFVAGVEEPDPVALSESLVCARSAEHPPALRALRGEGDLVAVVPIGDGGRLAGSARVAADGSLVYDGRLELRENRGLARLAVPGARAPGPPRLSTRDALVHVRLRPEGGLNVASMVPQGSQGDRLFRLKSELFLGTVLEGTWEAAVYLPPESRTMPGVVLGLDVRVRDAAVAAVERFVRDLETTWPVHRAPFRVGSWPGACLPDLRILPEFAPCYVATETTLVFGWNAESVRIGLEPALESEMGDEGGLVIRLDRIREADRRLHEAIAPGASPPPLGYGWQQLRANGTPGRGALELHVELVAEGES